MSIAIIAEYNPFHNGHIYQLKKTKELFPNDEIIIILSGKYVQRGEIAIASFNQRKEIALKYGANKVILLPFKYSTQAAHIFAEGAIKIINDNKIDKILFGSESNDVNKLIKIANAIYDNNIEYNTILRMNLKKGLSFPKSSNNALKEITHENITMPNDILAFEYIKNIIKNKYNIKPYSIKRTISYNSSNIYNRYASASYIRSLIRNKEDISNYTPMKIDNKNIDYIENHYKEFQNIVIRLSIKELKNIKLISEGMENLFKKHILAINYDEFVSKCNSKRYTSSRIKRVILYVLLKIRK